MNKVTTTKFNLNEHLPEIDITVETFPDWPGETSVYKKQRLSNELTLILYDSGQAVIEYRGDRSWDNTFYWNKEAAQLTEDIEYVHALELFEFLYRNRWKGNNV